MKANSECLYQRQSQYCDHSRLQQIKGSLANPTVILINPSIKPFTKTNKQYQLHEMFDPIMIGKGRGSTCNILHKIGEMGSSSPRLAKACRTRPLASLGKASHMALSPQIMAEIM